MSFDPDDLRFLVDANLDELDEASVTAFLQWAEDNPDEYDKLVTEVLKSPSEVLEKAAPKPVTADEHIALVNQSIDDRRADNKEVFAPSDMRGVLAAMKAAKADQTTIRAVGSFRSLSDVTMPADNKCTIIAMSRMKDVVADSANLEVYVGAGCTIGSLNSELERLDLALPNMGSGDFQTIAGIIATGSHGSGHGIGDLSSVVLAIELATYDNNGEPVLYKMSRPGVSVQSPGYTDSHIRVEQRPDPDEFYAALVGLGCLGIVTGLTLRIMPEYFLSEDRKPVTLKHFMDNFADCSKVRHYEVLFTPFAGKPDDNDALITTRKVVPKGNHRIRAPGLEMAARPIGGWIAKKRLGGILNSPKKASNAVVTGVRCTTTTNYARKSHRVLKLGLNIDATGLEIGVPISNALKAVTRIRAIMAERWKHCPDDSATPDELKAFWRDHCVVTSPVSMRIAARTETLLSMQYSPDPSQPDDTPLGEPYAMFEFPMLMNRGWLDTDKEPLYKPYIEGQRALFKELEQALTTELGGRVHWGQEFHAGDAELGVMWSDSWDRWKAVHKRFNALGVFRSAFSKRIGL